MFDDPGSFPNIPPQTVLTLLAVGFALAGLGHLYRWRLLIAVGLLVMFVAVFVLPVVLYLSGAKP